MSSNRASTSKPDPRIAKREVMVTRHKSAQMKRQLRTKDRSMKHLTDLLKSPTKETQTATKTAPAKKKQPSPKAKQSLLKSVEKVQNLPQKTFKLSKVLRKEILLIPDEEYYPNKLKRKINVKKVVLKPKNDFQIVGEISGSVKRKCGIPSKATDTPYKPAPDVQRASPLSKLSMAEAMRIMEEQLTDEDMMEILTCPSPVWWEDPPDENYVEDALFTRSPCTLQASTPETTERMEVDTENIESDIDRIILIPNLSEKSDKFLKKRSKLEDLLGNIKDKSNTNTKHNTEDKLNVVVKSSNDRVNRNDVDVNEVTSICDSEKRKARLSESDDEIIFHNSSMNEDELLKDLENMDIPIANRSSSSDVIVIDDDDDFLEKQTRSESPVAKENESSDEATVSDAAKAVNEDKNSDTGSNEVEVPKNLPTLQKCELSKVTSSPRSIDSLSSKSSVASSQDIDSISDTNIKFLLEDEVDDSKDTQALNDKMAAKLKEVVKESTNAEPKESDKEDLDNNSVTVYKIIEEISNDTSNEVINNEMKEKVNLEEDTRSNAVKLNDYYKKCKKIQKRVKKEDKTDINKNDVQTDDYKAIYCDSCKPSFKRVSDNENVKYCLICSSIFDTKECNYCISKSKNTTHICGACNIKFCCETFYKMHKCNGEQKSCRQEIGKILQKHDPSDPSIRLSNYTVS